MSTQLYTNVYNEVAYVLPDGAIQPGWGITNSRAFMKRLWVMFMQEGKRPPDIRANGGGTNLIPSFGFLSNLNTGEVPSVVTESYDHDFMDIFTPEFMQFYNPDTWGMNVSWMGPNGNWIKVNRSTPAGEAAYRHHHAVLMGCSYLHGFTRVNDGSQSPTTQLARWGMGQTDVVFHPYWEPMDFANLRHPGDEDERLDAPGQSALRGGEYRPH